MFGASCFVASVAGLSAQHTIEAENVDPQPPWNFLVVLLDDAGWRDTGFMGNDFIETPQMDALAREGMVFTQAYATHSFCTPTRQSMVTGQYPARTAWKQASEVNDLTSPRPGPPFSPAVAHAWTNRRPEFTSLAEALKNEGYATGHIGKWHFGIHAHDISPRSEGFDVNFGGHAHVGAVRDFFYPYEGLPGSPEGETGEYLTDRLTDEAVDFIEANRNGPFFLQLWHYAPHTPIQAKEELVAKYRAKRRAMGDMSLNPTYAAMMESTDQSLGRIRDALERAGIAGRTVIFLTSDNGAQANLGSVPVTSVAPHRGEKGHLQEGGIREPMAVYWPGVTAAGTSSSIPVTVMDFVPTMLNAAAASVPSGQPLDGADLRPILNRQPAPPEFAERSLFWYGVKSVVIDTGEILSPVAAVRRGDFKLIHYFFGQTHLYHVIDDPAESHDLAQAQPELVTELLEELRAWVDDVGIAPPVPNSNYDPDYVVPRQVDCSRVYPGEVAAEWRGEGLPGWQAARMVDTEPVPDGIRLVSAGLYPEIAGPADLNLPPGQYLVEVEYRFPTTGRFRFHWFAGNNEKGTIEFYPVRDGTHRLVRGIFEVVNPLQRLRLAAPTHLTVTGHYDPEVHEEWVELRAIRLRKLSN